MSESSSSSASVPKRGLSWLLAAVAQVAFNDNAAKLMLIGLAGQLVIRSQTGEGLVKGDDLEQLKQEETTKIQTYLAVLLPLPYIILSPLAGWLSDRYSKWWVLNAMLVFQLLLMGGLMAAIWAQDFIWAGVLFFFLAVQSAFFSPAKQGVLKELVGEEGLGKAVGLQEMLTLVGVLAGTFAGGVLLTSYAKTPGGDDPWLGAWFTVLWLGLGSILALGIFQFVPRTPAQSDRKFEASILWEHFSLLGYLFSRRNLRLPALGIAYFWTVGPVVLFLIDRVARDLHQGSIESPAAASFMALTIGLGSTVGFLAASGLSRSLLFKGLIPLGAFGIPLFLFLGGLTTDGGWWFYSSLFLLGGCSGLLLVPLNTMLQQHAHDDERARVIAGSNMLSFTVGLPALGIPYLMVKFLELDGSGMMIALAVPTLMVAVIIAFLMPESILVLVTATITGLIYRVKVIGEKNIPEGGALMICNHVSYVDAILLQYSCPRKVRFLAYDGFFKIPGLAQLLKLYGVIPISSKRARDAITKASDAISNGDLVCIFPEGQLTRTGSLLKLHKGFEMIVKKSGAPVLPVHLDSLWGSIFSYADSRYFWKMPRHLPYPVTVGFGEPIPTEKVNVHTARQALLDLGEASFSQRRELDMNLGLTVFKSLARRPWRTAMVDYTAERKVLSRGMLLSVALELAKKWRELPDSRVGIVLPPGIAGTVSNLALTLAGKTPVNLNFTAGEHALKISMEKGEITKVISAPLMKRKAKDFPWPEGAQFIDIGAEIKGLSKVSLLSRLAALWILPLSLSRPLFCKELKGGDSEGVLLFTSGSSGTPKGVVLTHRNVLANVAQFSGTALNNQGDTMLGCLPLFHSLGLTVTLWLPLIQRIKLVTVPSPLELKKIGEALEAESCTCVLGTPTFFKPYLRKFDEKVMNSVRFAVAGAEKLSPELLNGFKDRFDTDLLEGYGLTETAPVLSVNITNPPTPEGHDQQLGIREGTVGRLLPGITARVMDPASGEELSLHDSGILKVKGPNVFKEYLGEAEKTSEVKEDDWFTTGDMVHFDEDGFLHIEGRLSRFSKIGGEMVPHGVVEEALRTAFEPTDSESQVLAVMGRSDADKGEALVVLTTVDLDAGKVRSALSDAGLPNLWIPKEFKKIESIPVLGTGKLDLKTCKEIAAG